MTTFNINKNNVLLTLQQLVNKSIDFRPNIFNKKQSKPSELFTQRLFLEKVIDEAISFNRKLVFENKNKNLHLVNTAEDLIDVFKLRSNVYANINYQEEFPDSIKGLNFDKYDSNSAILFYKKDATITGTIRVIFDSSNKLPSEDKFSFNGIRKNYDAITELSRLIVKKESKNLTLEFKYLFSGIYTLFNSNNIDIILSSIIKKHYKLYSKFGGTNIINDNENYGKLGHSVITLSWDPSKSSNFFKKAFLG
ncbi:MAG: GNAT family N-acetyltransferase [Campylobacterales bacterium]|nr:GNAT family N-acetyltransferase [Campylobacterales bacterium]